MVLCSPCEANSHVAPGIVKMRGFVFGQCCCVYFAVTVVSLVGTGLFTIVVVV